MATGAGRHMQVDGFTVAENSVEALSLLEDGEARIVANDGTNIGEKAEAKSEGRSGAQNGVRAEVRAMPPIIEVTDEDYRSFCFPCHALDEEGDCNDGY